MTFLAFLFAALLATAGLIKVRSGQRVGIGILPGTVLELAAAVGIAVAAVATGGRVPGWVIVAGFALFLTASVHHVAHLRRVRRRREASEGGRLAAYVKYLSVSDGPSHD